MSDLYAFEPEALTASGAATGARARELIDLTRRTLLAHSALIKQGETGDLTTIDSVADEARAALDRAIADALERVANRVETGASAEPIDVHAPLEALKVQRPSTREAAGLFDSEIALCDVLVDRVEALQRGAQSEVRLPRNSR